MNVSDWVLIITTLFLGAVAIATPVLSELIKRRVFSPRISPSFIETSPYCHKTFYRSPANSPVRINEPSFFFRFKVENTGASKLKNCEAKLDQLWVFDSAGKPQKLSGFNDITLVWASGRRTVLDLDPHRRGFCNIGHVASPNYQNQYEKDAYIDIPGNHEKQLRFLFELAEFPYSQPNCLVPGKYAVKIVVYAENASTTELWFEIAWSGKWQENETEMFRELTVTQISKLE